MSVSGLSGWCVMILRLFYTELVSIPHGGSDMICLYLYLVTETNASPSHFGMSTDKVIIVPNELREDLCHYGFFLFGMVDVDDSIV